MATPAPRAGQKMCASGGRSGRGAGWQTSGYRTEGKHPDTLHAKHRASRKRPPEGHRCAERSESPAGACPPARRPLPAQEPDKGNRPTRADKPTRPDGRLCYARRRRGQGQHRRRTNKADGSRNRQRPTERPSRSGSDGTTKAAASPHDRRSETSYRAGRRPPPARNRPQKGAGGAQGRRARPALTFATTARHGIDITSRRPRGIVNARPGAFRPRARGESPLFIAVSVDLYI